MRALRIQAKDGFVLLLEDKTCIPIKFDSKEEVTKQLAMSMSVCNSKFEEGELIINGDKMTFKDDKLKLVDWKELFPNLDWDALKRLDTVY